MTITTGTEKQIAWATTIKADSLAAWTEFMGRLTVEDARRDIVAAIIEQAGQITDAATWIDGRGNARYFMRRAGVDHNALAALGFDARLSHNALTALPSVGAKN